MKKALFFILMALVLSLPHAQVFSSTIVKAIQVCQTESYTESQSLIMEFTISPEHFTFFPSSILINDIPIDFSRVTTELKTFSPGRPGGNAFIYILNAPYYIYYSTLSLKSNTYPHLLGYGQVQLKRSGSTNVWQHYKKCHIKHFDESGALVNITNQYPW